MAEVLEDKQVIIQEQLVQLIEVQVAAVVVILVVMVLQELPVSSS